MKNTSSQRSLRWAALLLLATLPAVPAYARPHHSEAWARDHFASAERMREALNGRPQADRSRRDFQRVINAYRNVYYGAPASSKADPSVVAVAETMVEMGRRFDDDKILKDAIGQYKFLRREYPGSKYRCDALFTIGEIYKDDLGDPDSARTTFQEFLHRYPKNRLVDDAQQAIAELDHQEAEQKKEAAQKKADAGKVAKGATGKNRSAKDIGAKDIVAKDAAAKEADAKASGPKDAGANDAEPHADATPHDAADRDSEQHSGRLPRVTGIRHWSTPDYTRVAIDLESEVKFGSQRIADPDRIFFDLRDTKLASTLVGKSFDVDDGFLRKIRVAQFQPGRTRVVLEVDDLSDYDAFLLPNPYRLIIDIHGKEIHGKDAHGNTVAKAARGKSPRETANAAEDVESAPVAGSTVARAAGATTSKASTNFLADVKDLHSATAKTEDDAEDDDSDASSVPSSTSAPKIAETKAAAISKPHRVPGAVHTTVGPNGVKKVIVDADYIEHRPTTPSAKRDTLASDRHAASAPAVAAKNDDAPDTDADPVDPGKDEKAAIDPPAASHNLGKAAHSEKTTRPLAANTNGKENTNDLDIHEARPTSNGDRSLIRALGLKIGKIVIDPGHGGHDTGTIGPNGLEEKDLVLEVGRKLGKLLETRLGAEVVYTRKNDTFIPLETRTAIANQQRADLFISIHANSSHDPDARGVETYYLNFTSSPEALEVAARENAVSEKSIYELQDLVKKIALKEKIEESREFAGDVQESLHSGLAVKSPGIRNRGVKKAPFIVLIGANMPSILAEISFVSNPGDEHRLETSEYRQRIAESLYRGIAKYVNGLSGVKVASKMDRTAGQ